MIRNFSIIAHIDHGKSTLADRFLELTHTLRKEEMREQFLDQMDLERERGITIKMQPCFMEYEFEGKKYQLNLIDTPGHMDFAYEVERSLSAVEAVILLVDVNCGVQAQTLANFQLAKSRGLKIIPVLNKIDACYDPEQIERVKQEVASLTGVGKDEILAVSAKTGLNVEKILERLIKEAPAPKTGGRTELEALVFDSFYDNYQGVIACVRIFSGQVKKGDQLFLLNQKRSFPARDIGIFKPRLFSLPCLEAGRIGYIATGIKEVSDVRIGETVVLSSQTENRAPLPGYKEPKPLVFANIFPPAEQNYETLKTNIEKLRLNDTSLTLQPISNPYLGRGLRVGFLGILHLEIALERLKREYDTPAIVTSPSVVFEAKLRNKNETVLIHSAVEMPPSAEIEYLKEPWVKMSIITPSKYLNKIHQVMEQKRGEFVSSEVLDENAAVLLFKAPLMEIIEDFLDKIKSVSEGFASFSYEFESYQKSDLVKLDFLVSHEVKPCFSRVVHQTKCQAEAQEFLIKLKKTLPPKNFSQALQASVEGRIIAREDIKAMRKDVTAGLYGGDYTRKKKVLQKQKKGKKRLEGEGTTAIPEDVYLKLIRR